MAIVNDDADERYAHTFSFSFSITILFIYSFLLTTAIVLVDKMKFYKMQFTSLSQMRTYFVILNLYYLFIFRWMCSLSFELIEAIDFKSWQPRMHDLNSIFFWQRIFQQLRALHTHRHMSTTTATETHMHDYYYRRTWQIAFSDVDNLYMSELES